MLQEKDAESASSDSELKDITDHRALDIMEDDVGDLGLALLQERGTVQTHGARAAVMKFLNKNQGASETTSDALDARKKRALETLAETGRRVGSALLLSTAIKLG